MGASVGAITCIADAVGSSRAEGDRPNALRAVPTRPNHTPGGRVSVALGLIFVGAVLLLRRRAPQ